jgi:hypothetical protein
VSFNKSVFDTGIPYFPRVLQIVCTPSHTILHWEGQTPIREVSALNCGKRRFDFFSAPGNATIFSEYYDHKFGGVVRKGGFSRRTSRSLNHSLTDYEGEQAWQ